jgi:hypothetical protein
MSNQRRHFLVGAVLAVLAALLSPATSLAAFFCRRRVRQCYVNCCRPQCPLGDEDGYSIPHQQAFTMGQWQLVTVYCENLYSLQMSGGTLDATIVDNTNYPNIIWTCQMPGTASPATSTTMDSLTFWAQANQARGPKVRPNGGRPPYGTGYITITVTPNGNSACNRYWTNIPITYS